ncbi:MAG: hypothetical protein H0S80_04035 [Desulfovibrionaceae bacterium]|nr:hypothetical protein [Desulfovibrionaceae bacterium]
MPTVDSTNSYVTEAEAATYFGERLYATAWTGASEADQQKALLMARRLLDLHISWKGTPTDEDQALAWPREGITGIDDDEIPEAVETAQLELALTLLGTDLTASPEGQGIARQKVDVIETEYNPADRGGVIPDSIVFMLSSLGSLRGRQVSFSVSR